MSVPATESNEKPWPRYRPPHRGRHDASVHAEAADLPSVLDHPRVPAGEPGWVDTDAALTELVETLRGAGTVAFDTEFIGEQSFFPQFCVIQAATAEHVWLIDPLAGIDVTPFWALLTDASVEVVVHAGKQDIEPVFRLTGHRAANVFDTQLAAGFAGLGHPLSLGKLTAALLPAAELGADHKFSAWDRRPLSATQRAYAANDVRYLLLLRDELRQRVEALGHLDKLREELGAFTDPDSFRNDPLTAKLKARGASDLSRRQQAVANALLRWRYEEAQRQDVPVRALMDDVVLTELARQPVQNVDEVQRFKGMPWPVKERYAEALVARTAEALAGELPAKRKRYRPMSDAAEARLAALWPAVITHCEQAGVAPGLTLNKKELTALVRASDAGAPPPDSRLRSGWRRDFLAPVLGELVTA